jgi:hypothetical protein
MLVGLFTYDSDSPFAGEDDGDAVVVGNLRQVE